MDAPALVVVPATPSKLDADARHWAPGDSTYIPHSPLIRTKPEEERASSETIVTIFSMYGDNRGSWQASRSPSRSGSTSEELKPGAFTTTSPTDSLCQGSRRTSNASAFYTSETTPASRRSSKVMSSSVISDSNAAQGPLVLQHSSSSRPVSSKSRNVDVANDEPQRGHVRVSYASHHSAIGVSAPLPHDSVTTDAANEEDLSRNLSSHPHQLGSSKRLSHISKEEHSSLKSPSPPRLSSRLSREVPPLPRTASPAPPPVPAKDHISIPPLHTQSPSMPTGSSSRPHSSPAPSDGEDPDSFHVRNTYARLDLSGVVGDGYEEGVERTRAKVTNNRLSEARLGPLKSGEISSKETELLASLDRYGFFNVPSHDRLVLLPTVSLTKPFTPQTQVSSKSLPNATSLPSIPNPKTSPKETRRIGKWIRMMEPRSRDEGGNADSWKVKPEKERKLRERTYKGIPDCWRNAAWNLLARRFTGSGKDSDMRRLDAEYREALEKPSTFDIQIDLDVPRTISGHVLFRTRYGHGQRSLFHVLHSFSLRCGECGYCQGMGPIAATLLCYMEPEKVYALLALLHDNYRTHSIFLPGFPGLLEAIYVQERLMERMLPGVYGAFKNHMVSTTSYATKWYITLFANSVPFQTQLRLWDAFLLDGRDVFVVMALGVVWVYRDHITSSQASFETILSLLSSFFIPDDEDVLMQWIEKAMSNRKLREDMDQWRRDWHELVAAGKDSTALL